jgi:hypothetical protein
MLQLRMNDEPIGKAVDFYAPAPELSGPQKLANIQFAAGTNLLSLTLPGKNPKSEGVGVNLIRIHGVRLR